MLDEESSRESFRFGVAVLCLSAAVIAFHSGAMVTAVLLVAAGAIFGALFFTGASLLPPRTDGTPHPDDEWFKTHEWWEPEPEQPTSGSTSGGSHRQSDDQGYWRWSDWGADRARSDEGRARARTKPAYTFSATEARTLLGIQDGATPDQARAAYRRAAMRAHPDHGGDKEVFLRVQAAWESLEQSSRFAQRIRTTF